MNINTFFQSKTFVAIILLFCAIIALLLAFKIGVFVGYQKASFSYRWGENYHRNFAGPAGGFMGVPPDRNFINSHGIFGQIIKIEGNTLLIDGKGEAEKTIVVSDKTIIRRQMDTIQVTDLKINEQITVIGSPNDQGQIEANLIRVFP